MAGRYLKRLCAERQRNEDHSVSSHRTPISASLFMRRASSDAKPQGATAVTILFSDLMPESAMQNDKGRRRSAVSLTDADAARAMRAYLLVPQACAWIPMLQPGGCYRDAYW